MTELNTEILVKNQDVWAKIVASGPEQFEKNLEGIENLIIDLKNMGLNMAHDSSYELLAPGLTRQEFRQKRTEMFMLQALDTYHGSRRISDDDFLGSLHKRQYAHLRKLVTFDLPSYESHLASSGLSDNVNPLLVQEINNLCALKNAGHLDAELSRLNVERIKDFFRTAYSMNAEQEKEIAKGGELHYRVIKQALGYAEGAVKALDEAGGNVTPCMIPVDYNSKGYWEDKRITFDRAAIVGLHDSLLLKVCGVELKEAVAFQDQGHFVLDASGSGHGMMVLPIQRIVDRLVENKYNLKVPATFTAMGTTPVDFWAAYDRERAAVTADPENAKRLKPEFKR